MNSWTRSIAAVLGTLALSGVLDAAPPPPGGPTDPTRSAIQRRPQPPPPPAPPLYSLTPLCTTGPAPQVKVYVQPFG